MAKLKLEPLGQRDPLAKRGDRAGRKLPPRHNRTIGTALIKAWQNAQAVDDQQIAAFQPTTLDCLVAEALLNGETSVKMIAFSAGVSPERVKRVMHDPVSMAWISRTLKSLITHRIGMLDSALFQRSLTGDPSACKLMYERIGALSQDHTVQHVYSGGVNISALSTEDLRKLVYDKSRILSVESRIIDVRADPVAPKSAVPSPTGAQPEVSGEGPSSDAGVQGDDGMRDVRREGSEGPGVASPGPQQEGSTLLEQHLSDAETLDGRSGSPNPVS